MTENIEGILEKSARKGTRRKNSFKDAIDALVTSYPFKVSYSDVLAVLDVPLESHSSLLKILNED